VPKFTLDQVLECFQHGEIIIRLVDEGPDVQEFSAPDPADILNIFIDTCEEPMRLLQLHKIIEDGTDIEKICDEIEFHFMGDLEHIVDRMFHDGDFEPDPDLEQF